MTDENDNAFPLVSPEESEEQLIDTGMSKLEYFAVKAMQGLLTHPFDLRGEIMDRDQIAINAVKQANALIDALNSTD